MVLGSEGSKESIIFYNVVFFSFYIIFLSKFFRVEGKDQSQNVIAL